MQPFSNKRTLALAAFLSVLTGCSEYTNEYLDRRDTISIQGGNAVQAAKVTHMVDPWPPASADKHITYNGAVMGAAFQRYRTGKVIQPSGIGTSTTYGATPDNNSSNSSNNNAPPVGPAVGQAPSKGP